ncbi:MAG TPA: hypothetical protein VNR11_17015 [Xanthobacteraceae bacterium]|nr:hypothetical protein [Xanthobacteraceae bacterium]
MPTETIVVLAAILAGFILFAGALAWADFQCSRPGRPQQPAE